MNRERGQNVVEINDERDVEMLLCLKNLNALVQEYKGVFSNPYFDLKAPQKVLNHMYERYLSRKGAVAKVFYEGSL